MQEALIVAIMTFVGLVAWATVINVAVKAMFDVFDRTISPPAPRSSQQRVVQFRMGDEPIAH